MTRRAEVLFHAYYHGAEPPDDIPPGFRVCEPAPGNGVTLLLSEWRGRSWWPVEVDEKLLQEPGKAGALRSVLRAWSLRRIGRDYYHPRNFAYARADGWRRVVWAYYRADYARRSFANRIHCALFFWMTGRDDYAYRGERFRLRHLLTCWRPWRRLWRLD